MHSGAQIGALGSLSSFCRSLPLIFFSQTSAYSIAAFTQIPTYYGSLATMQRDAKGEKLGKMRKNLTHILPKVLNSVTNPYKEVVKRAVLQVLLSCHFQDIRGRLVWASRFGLSIFIRSLACLLIHNELMDHSCMA